MRKGNLRTWQVCGLALIAFITRRKGLANQQGRIQGLENVGISMQKSWKDRKKPVSFSNTDNVVAKLHVVRRIRKYPCGRQARAYEDKKKKAAILGGGGERKSDPTKRRKKNIGGRNGQDWRREAKKNVYTEKATRNLMRGEGDGSTSDEVKVRKENQALTLEVEFLSDRRT